MSLVTPRKGYKSVPWLFGKEIEIPQEWEVKKFEDIAKIRRGASPRPIEDSKYFGKGRGWIRISDVSKSKKYLKQTRDFLSDLGESNSVAVNDGDVILSIAASVGKPIIVKMKACIHDGFITFTNMSNTMNNEFLYYLLLKTKSTFTNIGQHGTQSNINSEIVSKTNFLKPPLPEQQKIASILTNVDNLIESTRQIITHSKKVKKGLMQKLLTRGIGHVTFKKVPWLFGKEIEIPQEWEIVKLKEISKLQGGYAFKSEDYQEQGIQLLKIANVSHGEFNWNEKSFVPKNYWNEYDDFQIKKGDIILAMTRPIISGGLKIAIFNETKNILLNQRVGKFILQNVNSYFFFCMINQKSVIEQIITKIGESGQPNISSDEVGEIKICYNNNIQEQQKIATILSNIDSKITSQEQYKEKLQKLKKSLMQKLLTGEVRV